MDKRSPILIAGHTGLVGSALVRLLRKMGYENILTVSHGDCDLTNVQETDLYFRYVRPGYVIHAAGRVGGIVYNITYLSEFMYENALIALNLLWSCKEHGVKKVLYLGSSCIYPRKCRQPMREKDLIGGKLEPTNCGYAMAKLYGIEFGRLLRQQYGLDVISALPTNLYGPNDNYHPDHSHVIPGMIRKFHEAKRAGKNEVVLWGTGAPMREFLYVDDLAQACVFLMENYSEPDPVNIGSGDEISISDLADTIAYVVGFDGDIVFDTSKPDGMPRKLLDSSKIRGMGWYPVIDLSSGLALAYKDFLAGGGRNSGMV